MRLQSPGKPFRAKSCRESPTRLKSARPEKIPERRRQGQPELFELDCDFAGQNRARRSSKDSDAARLVGLKQFFVDRDHIIDRGGKWIFRREAIIDGNNFDLRQIRDRNAFDQRAGIGIESAAMQIDQHAIAIGFGHR